MLCARIRRTIPGSPLLSTAGRRTAVRISARELRSAAATLTATTLLLIAAATRAADPQPYSVTIDPTGVVELDLALNDVSTLISLRESAPAGPFALVARAQQDRDRFVSALRSFGYYKGKAEVRISGRPLDDPRLLERLDRMPREPPVAVTVALDRGPLFRLRAVELQGNVPPEIRAKLDLKPGAPAVASDVLAAGDRLLGALRDQGYALAKVDPPVAILQTDANALDLTYTVDAGPRVKLGDISVKGSARVDESFIDRRLTIRPGEQFNATDIEKARQDLASLGVFSTVRARTAEELDDQGRLPVEFYVTERPQRSASVSGAYSTDIGGSVSLSWRHRNLFGSAEQLNLTGGVAQIGGNSTTGIGYNAAASLLKPDWLLRDQSLQTNLGAIKQSLNAFDQKAVTAGLLVNRRFSNAWSGSLGLAAEQAEIRQQGVSQDYTLFSLPATMKYDDTDSVLDPTKGMRAAVLLTPTQPLAGPAPSPFVLTQASGSTYFDLHEPGRSVLALRSLLGYAAGVGQFQLPADKRLYAGSSATVRGYKFQSIGPRFPDGKPQGGTAVVAGTIEFRQRFWEDYGAVLFIDAGQVTANGAPFVGDWRLGSGIGARYYTALGPIRLDVALPLSRFPGSGSFQLYIGLGQAF